MPPSYRKDDASSPPPRGCFRSAANATAELRLPPATAGGRGDFLSEATAASPLWTGRRPRGGDARSPATAKAASPAGGRQHPFGEARQHPRGGHRRDHGSVRVTATAASLWPRRRQAASTRWPQQRRCDPAEFKEACERPPGQRAYPGLGGVPAAGSVAIPLRPRQRHGRGHESISGQRPPSQRRPHFHRSRCRRCRGGQPRLRPLRGHGSVPSAARAASPRRPRRRPCGGLGRVTAAAATAASQPRQGQRPRHDMGRVLATTKAASPSQQSQCPQSGQTPPPPPRHCPSCRHHSILAAAKAEWPRRHPRGGQGNVLTAATAAFPRTTEAPTWPRQVVSSCEYLCHGHDSVPPPPRGRPPHTPNPQQTSPPPGDRDVAVPPPLAQSRLPPHGRVYPSGDGSPCSRAAQRAMAPSGGGSPCSRGSPSSGGSTNSGAARSSPGEAIPAWPSPRQGCPRRGKPRRGGPLRDCPAARSPRLGNRPGRGQELVDPGGWGRRKSHFLRCGLNRRGQWTSRGQNASTGAPSRPH